VVNEIGRRESIRVLRIINTIIVFFINVNCSMLFDVMLLMYLNLIGIACSNNWLRPEF